MLALIPLALSLAPELARWVFGDTPAVTRTTDAVRAAVEAVTGTADAGAQAALIARDPDAAAKLRVRLAEVAAAAEAAQRQADASALAAQLADIAGARAQTVDLARAGSGIAWGAPTVSVVVLLTFGVTMALALTRAMPAGSEALLNVLLGSLAAMATSVVSYWVGSSAGSARKDARLASLASGAAGQA